MSKPPRIDYRFRPDISSEEEVKILAAVYGFLLDRHAEKAANRGRYEAEGGVNQTQKVVGKREER